MRPDFRRLEWKGFDRFDLDLLRSRGLPCASPNARRAVLIGRLQRELGLLRNGGNFAFALAVDGLYGPHTDRELQVEEDAGEPLGPELRQIVDEERSKVNRFSY